MTSRNKKCFLSLMLALFAVAGNAMASVTVQDIQVQANAPDALQAKDKAIAKGEIEAFQKIAASINSSISAKDIPPARISATIDSYDIQSESMSSTSYKAVVDYNFDKDKVENLVNGLQPSAADGAEPRKQITRANLVNSEFMILVPINGLQNWLKVKQDITATPGVSAINIIAFSLSQVDATVKFSGTPATLASTLQNKGYEVSQEQNYWIVKR